MRAAALAWLALVPVAAHAQDTADSFTVDTVAVTVTRSRAGLDRMPVPVSLVSRARIQDGRLGIGLDEALGDVPGVHVANRYNFALGTRISVRGFGARAAFGVRGVRLIADGIPLTMPDGQSNLNNIDLTSAGRIEVLRGAASMLYGNAAGGVIEVVSETPPAGFLVEARAAGADLGRGGVDNLQRFNAKAGGGSADTRYLVSAARVVARGAREHSRFEQNNLSLKVEHARSRGRTWLTASLADAPVAENPGSLPRDSALARPRMAWPRNVATQAGEKSRQLQLGLGHRRRMGGGEAGASVYGLSRTLDNPLPFAYITLDRKAAGARSTFAARTLTLGVDVEAQEDARAEYENQAGSRGAQRRDQIDRVVAIGPFARLVLPLSSQAALTAGVRYDRVQFEVVDHFLSDGRDDSGERTMAAVSPAVGVTLNPLPTVTLFASASTSFQTPTTTEMVNAPPPAGVACCPAGFNPLEPQRALSFEAGTRAVIRGVRVDAAIFHMRVSEALVPFQIATVPGRDFFRNAGKTRHQGVELALDAELNRFTRVSTSYTHSRFTFVDDGIDSLRYEGNRLPGIPPHRAVVRVVAAARHLVVEPEAEFASAYYADDANSPAGRVGGTALFNLRLRTTRPLAGTTLMPFAAAHNLTDRKYSASVVINAAGSRFFEPAPGRNFFIGLSLFAGTADRPH